MSKIAIISGSQRSDSQSLKVANALAAKLTSMDNCASVDVLDLGTHPLPFWDMKMSDEDKQAASKVADKVVDKDAFIVITPEWHGMVPASLKNFFLHFGKDYFAHKPALIVAVSAGVGGAYVVNELRTSSYKNSRLCYLPEHLIIRGVSKVFNENGENDEKSHKYLSNRADYCLSMLLSYSDALKQVRQQLPDDSEYANGM